MALPLPPWVEPLRKFHWGRADDGMEVLRDVRTDFIPNLYDWATRMRCLAVLARRVGLDPEGGVLWVRMQKGGFTLFIGGDRVRTHPPGFHNFDDVGDDPLLALALALRATAPVSGGPNDAR